MIEHRHFYRILRLTTVFGLGVAKDIFCRQLDSTGVRLGCRLFRGLEEVL